MHRCMDVSTWSGARRFWALSAEAARHPMARGHTSIAASESRRPIGWLRHVVGALRHVIGAGPMSGALLRLPSPLWSGSFVPRPRTAAVAHEQQQQQPAVALAAHPGVGLAPRG
ncbi:unnamed protein product [Lampetra planeri]